MDQHSAPLNLRLLLALLGVIGLGRAALGLHAYPYGDDMVYGPLARLAADPSLYPGDVQLRSFENHAWLYSAIWRGAEATIGVVPAHLILTLILTFAVGGLMLGVFRALNAPGWFAPLVFLIATVVEQRGIGRGDYGGAFGDHFHLQSVAIALCLAAFLAVLHRKWVLAGMVLGLAALCQPALAVQGAAAAGVGAMAMGRSGLRPIATMAAVSIFVAMPVIWSLLASPPESQVDVQRVVEDGYLWRADNHYLIPLSGNVVFALYAALGLLGAQRSRSAVGIVIGLAIFGLLSDMIYSDPFKLGLDQLSIFPYMLDLTRSSPLLWVFGCAVGGAALERAVVQRDWPLAAPLAGLSVALIVINFDFSPLGVIALCLAILVATMPSLRSQIAAVTICVAGLGSAVWAAMDVTPALERDPKLTAFYEWAGAETAKDAMFIAPPFIADIRELAQRPVWVDFRAVSMAQPDQTLLSRMRHAAITPDYQDLPKTGGWAGAYLWTLAYSSRHDTGSIETTLRETGATFFVTYTTDETSNLGGANLEIAYADDQVVVFRLSPP